VTVVILVREIGVTVLRFWVIRHGVIPASRGGKAKTFAQALAIELYLLPLPDGAAVLALAAMAVALVLTLATGADYVVRAVRLRRATRPARSVAAPAPGGPAPGGVAAAGGRAAGGVASGGVPPAAVHAALEAHGATVAVAESLTAGLLAAALTETPGTSRTFRGGLVVYATDLKASLGGVPADLLAEFGPVSAPVAEAMAEGVRRRLAAGYGVALTGVAGPDPQGGEPVGTVYVAVAGPRGTVVRRLALAGDRARIRADAVQAALDLLATTLSGRSASQDLQSARNQ
jgi:nicotinamide-nucleotide amidase